MTELVANKTQETRFFPFDEFPQLKEVLLAQRAKRDELQTRYGIEIRWLFFHYDEAHVATAAKVVATLRDRGEAITCAELVQALGAKVATVWHALNRLDRLGSIRRREDTYSYVPGGERHRVPSTGGRLKSYKTAWTNACRRAGLTVQLDDGHIRLQRTPHDLRRTAVSNMNDAGISEAKAMALSGHRSSSVHRRYNLRERQQARKAVPAYAALLEKKREQFERAKRDGTNPNPTT